MSREFAAAMKRAQQAELGEDVTPSTKPAKPTYQAREKSIARKIVESTLYDGQPVARFLLNQIAVLAMKDEDAEYPDDAPTHYPDGTPWEKTGWCWMAQWNLSNRIGTDPEGRTLRNWIAKFREDGTVLYRDWRDDNGTKHSEYKVVEEIFDAHQRPTRKEDALASRAMTKRYAEGSRKANATSFSKTNQPKMSAQLLEMDDE